MGNYTMSWTVGIAHALSDRIFGLGSHPRFPPSQGIPVGVLDVRVPGEHGVMGRVYYPAEDGSGEQSNDPYFRAKAVDGVVAWLGKFPKWLFSTLSRPRSRPFQEGAMMKAPPVGKEHPVLVFSHGLGGTCEMYSELCSSLAAQGALVIALEHEDGSASYALQADGRELLYRHPPNHIAPTAENTRRWRAPQLLQRVQEIEAAVAWLQDCATGNGRLHEMLKMCHQQQPVLIGHSFGGAATVLAAQHLQEHLLCCIVLDGWLASLQVETVEKGCEIPALAIITQDFFHGQEKKHNEHFMQACKTRRYGWIPGSKHQSFSDSPFWLPQSLGEKLHMNGKADATEIMQDTAMTVHRFIDSCLEGAPLCIEALVAGTTHLSMVPDMSQDVAKHQTHNGESVCTSPRIAVATTC